MPGGDQNNRLIYGSLDSYGIDLNNMKPKPKAPQVKKYYQTPDHFVYGQRDFLYKQQNSPASKKLSNIFSMEERTSAEMKKKQREVEETGMKCLHPFPLPTTRRIIQLRECSL